MQRNDRPEITEEEQIHPIEQRNPSTQNQNDTNLQLTPAYTLHKPYLFGIFTRPTVKMQTTPLLNLANNTDPELDAIKELLDAIANMQTAESTQNWIVYSLLAFILFLNGILPIIQGGVNAAQNSTPASNDAFNISFNTIEKGLTFIATCLTAFANARRNTVKNLKNNMIDQLDQSFNKTYRGPR